MRSCKGRMMVSINDHPDIRQSFDGLPMFGLDITYTVGTADSRRAPSRELVIMNWEQDALGQLF